MTRKRRTAEHRAAICKSRNWICHICELPVDPVNQRWELDHVIPLASGGKDDDDNLWPAHSRCHLEKTVKDVGIIAKGKRMRARHLGTKPPSPRPIPCGRKSPWKKKLDGSVVPRFPAPKGD